VVRDGVEVPFIGRLPIQRSAALKRDVVKVLAVNQSGRPGVVVLAAVESRVDGRAGFDMQAHAGAQMKLARGVLTRWNVDLAPAHFAAGVNGFLQRRAGIVGLEPGCAVVFDIKDALRRSELIADSQA